MQLNVDSVAVLDLSPFLRQPKRRQIQNGDMHRFGMSQFWTCRCFGVSPFWSVAVLVVAVLDLSPL